MILGLSIEGVILNLATLVLPLPLVWGLKLSLRDKASVAVLFLLGGG